MPTNRPRLTITLTPKLHAALKAFSEGTGQSVSSLIVEFLDEALPALERMAVMVQAAKRAKPEALAEMRSKANRLQGTVQGLGNATIDALDLFLQPAAPGRAPERSEGRPQAKAAKGKARRPGVKPPSPNRGVGTPVSPLKPSSSKVTSIRSRRA